MSDSPVKEDATVKVAYVYENGAYRNSVGYFTFPSADRDTVDLDIIKKTEKIIFPNFSDNVLSLGNAVNIGTVSAGQSLGFTIVSNGWESGQVNPSKTLNGIFRTIKRLNPEDPKENNAHTVLFADPSHSLLVLSFEDLNRAQCENNDFYYCSDNDFNDVVIAIQVTPFESVDPTHIKNIRVVTGVSGPANWREVTSPDKVIDPIKEAGKEIMKAKNSQL